MSPPIAIYEIEFAVPPEDIDLWNHANNIAYLRWFMSAASKHSAANGWPAERYRELGACWVVRSHSLKYHRSALVDQVCRLRTWVASMSKVTSKRVYLLTLSDGTRVAEGESEFAFVNIATGKPVRVDPEVARSFIIVNQPE